MDMRLWCVCLVIACGSGPAPAVNSDLSTREESTQSSEENAQSSEAVAENPPNAVAAEEAAGEEEAGEDEAVPPAAVHFGTTDADAHTICDNHVSDDQVRFSSCAFRPGGQALPDGARVDIIEMEYEDMVTMRVALLVIRTPDEPSFPTTFTLAEASEQPGMSERYTLGALALDGTNISVAVQFVSTTYPNTGDPDRPTGAYDERASYSVRCNAVNGVYDCERAEAN